jgi:hypothetical protein
MTKNGGILPFSQSLIRRFILIFQSPRIDDLNRSTWLKRFGVAEVLPQDLVASLGPHQGV